MDEPAGFGGKPKIKFWPKDHEGIANRFERCLLMLCGVSPSGLTLSPGRVGLAKHRVWAGSPYIGFALCPSDGCVPRDQLCRNAGSLSLGTNGWSMLRIIISPQVRQSSAMTLSRSAYGYACVHAYVCTSKGMVGAAQVCLKAKPLFWGGGGGDLRKTRQRYAHG